MKQYLTYLFLLFINLSFSQQILNKAETVARTVSDPNVIILLNGFSASSAVVNPFIAKIGASSDPFTSGGTTNSTAGESNLSGEVGTGNFHDTKGEIAVGGDGQLQFNFPIALPPSINGVAPQMNLFYTSGFGSGIAGMGFSLSGVTSIKRVGKNIEKNGESKGVQLDYTDFYEFNGQRLLLKTPGDATTYGKDGTEYVTEKFSTLKIKSVGAVSGQSYTGPNSFEITFDNGSQAWYGITTDSQTPLEYNIVKWKDAQGNYITYNYKETNNVSVITSVQWGGNETLGKPHFNSIVFNYVVRDLQEVSYVHGVRFLQDKILSDIVVNANSKQFKKYVIVYDKDANGTNYQYAKTITEYNSQNQAANPVAMIYEGSSASAWAAKSYADNENNKIVGDFDGDGVLDYLKYFDATASTSICTKWERQDHSYNCVKYEVTPAKPKSIRFFKSFMDDTINGDLTVMSSPTFTKEEFNKAVVITFKNSNNEISSRQGIFLKGQIYSVDGNNQLKLEYSKPLTNDKTFRDVFTESGTRGTGDYQSYSVVTTVLDPMQMDLDGDGLSEIIIQIKDNTTSVYETIDSNNPPSPLEKNSAKLPPVKGNVITHTNSVEQYRYMILNLDNRVGAADSFSESPYYNKIFQKPIFGDFKGDGKISILNLETGNSSTITSFKKDKTSQKFTAETSPTSAVFSGLLENAVVGDFNGDKKTDLIIPVAQGTPVSTMNMQLNYKADALAGDWRLYLSTGTGFKEEYKAGIGKWYPFQALNLSNVTASRRINYQALDLDKDGKCELIQFDYYTIDSKLSAGKYSETTVTIMSDNGASSTIDVNFKRGYNSSFKNDGLFDYNELVGDFYINQINNNIVLLGKNRQDVSQGFMYTFSLYDTSKTSRINTITQGNIPTVIEYKELDSQLDSDFYASSKKEKYPYVELDRVSKSFVVAQLRQLERKKDFKYRGLLAHVNGKGMIGFRKSARTNWYASGFENTKIWSGLEIDPLQSGSVIKEWSTREDSAVFPTDVSVNNSQLLSFKFLEYTTDKSVTTGVETIVPYRSTEKDFLKNRTEITTMTYGSFYLVTKIETNINNGFATITSNTSYLDNATGTGKDYYVGRVKEKEDIVIAYSDTKKSKTAYTYENGLPKTITTFNQDYSKSVTDTYTYDGFGNVIEKKKANNQDSQAQSLKSEYDAKGLFVVKSTDNLGLITQNTSNDWGQILTQTDPLGNTLTNTYDGWGKLTKSKQNLTGTTTYTYEKQGDDIVVAEYSPTGNIKETRTNKKGEQYLIRTKGFESGSYIAQQVEYDAVGRKIRESELYDQAETPKWNVFSYDSSVFPAKVTVTGFNGKILETQVIGLTTTAKELNGYNRVNRKTSDVLGNTIESEDKGGVVKFAYNAAGQNVSATYGQNIVVTKYDSWGRKSEFTDPSNGTYRYDYDGLGKLLKETSPKGTKEYVYDPKGQLITQKELSVGDNAKATNKSISFIYNNLGMVTDRKGTTNGKSYLTYLTYDANGRVLTTSENSNGKLFFKKNITYDDKGRVISYDKGLYSSGLMTQTSLQNVYNTWSGDLYQIKDKNTGKVLSQINKVNANGQLLKVNLGAVTIDNNYDGNNFLTSTAHVSAVQPNVLQMTYSFDAIKNELKTRSRKGGIVVNEVFTYDDNNRLKSWTNPKTGILSTNTYDDKGRIVENDQTGTTTFRTDKIYQADTQVLNAVGVQNYNNNIPLTISYNENNDPIYIDAQNGDAQFSYGLTEMRQMVTYGGNFAEDKQGKFTKYYSEDGSYEITTDNTTGKEKHILYIGNPYDSDIIYTKNYTDASAKYLFLHKDYLGSILAISDEAGNLVEQRHFDAWGNLTNGVLSILDRGYTSHEHFAELAIIHMNGRLYDPMQRRFLNADENIQDPYNTQCYNKYGYVTNNPLLFNDPNGEFFGLGEGLLAAVVIGAIIGTASYMIGVTAAIMNGADASLSLSGMLKSAFWGAVSGAVTFGIGSCFTVAATGANTAFASSLQSAKFLVQAAAHGVAQGAMAMMQSGGAGFLSGAAGGFFGSLGATAWNAGAGEFARKGAGTIAFGALTGGVGAELAGGNFWQGAVTGGLVSGLNDVMHSFMEKQARKAFVKRFHKTNPFAKPEMNESSVYALLDDVDGLDALHKKSNYKIEVSYRKNSGMRGYTDNKTHYFYEDAFTSNFKLASTMFHEFYHAFQEVFMGGLAYRLAAKEGPLGYINGIAPLGGERYLERSAYEFEWYLGNHSTYVSEGIYNFRKL
ncbi:RHS repeat-associated protein [Flavobacterium sp. 9]|uniref:RHS repeat-associated core domain-containing protein n=1 Tax=Flavobacterium sp. 9 TaxID=2035198 RepID=UPI000C1864C2|nr:RHS repeat-associated core domain-containing protein [Flavobacterium sp. 9]PIF33469.1 RHS repeat-associated protein [Flavobacterium sp. 9]